MKPVSFITTFTNRPYVNIQMSSVLPQPSLHTFHLSDVWAYYLCRDHPKSKNETVQELRRVGISESRIKHIPAFSPSELSTEEREYWLNPANFYSVSRDTKTILERACIYKTHLKAIDTIIRDAETVPHPHPFLIVEEGVRFLWDSATSEISTLELPLPTRATLYYLGGVYEYSKPSKTNQDYTFENIRNKLYYDPYIQVVSKYFKIRRTFAYIVPTVESAVEIYNVLTNATRKQLDTMYITHFQNTDLNAYIIQPSLCILATDRPHYKDDFLMDGSGEPTDPPREKKHKDNTPLSFFYDDTAYTKERVLEFYRGGYHRVLVKLKKYYSYKKITYNVQNLFKHLRIVSSQMSKTG